jgi:thiamine biosynthesis lipoprotein
MQQFTHHFRAMGTDVGLWLWHQDEQEARRAFGQTEQFFAQSEARLSRFLPDSELSRLNQSAGRPFSASPLLFDLVEAALTWRERTGGIFDPTVLRTLIAHGYDRSFEYIAGQGDEPDGPPLAGIPSRGQVRLNRSRHSISMPSGVGLDLGGIAKGWAVQQAARRLGRLGAALVDAGGDITCSGTPPDGSSWLVGVADPRNPEADLASVRLSDEAVATSSLAHRRWQHHGQTAHHLIDPRIGAPAVTDLLSVTVIGSRLPDVEVHAKVALILGSQQGWTYLEQQPNLSALLVTTQGHQILYGSFEDKAYVFSDHFAEQFISLV